MVTQTRDTTYALTTRLGHNEMIVLAEEIRNDPLAGFYRLTHQWSQPTRNYFVLDEGLVVGCCLVSDIIQHGDTLLRGHIWLYIVPAYRGQGPGIWRTVEAQLRTEGFQSLYAEVHTAHRRSRMFARSIGFQPVGRLPQWYVMEGQPIDVMLYQKQVTDG